MALFTILPSSLLLIALKGFVPHLFIFKLEIDVLNPLLHAAEITVTGPPLDEVLTRAFGAARSAS